MTSPDRAPGADSPYSGVGLQRAWTHGTDGGIAAPLDHLEQPRPRTGSVPRSETMDPARLDRRVRRGAAGLLLLILVVIAVIVFWPGPPDPHGQSALHDYLDRAHRDGLPNWITFDFVQNAANVVMFAPLGLLGSLALRRRNYLIVFYSALASGFIELTQLLLLPDRVASLEDVMANTAGALVGFLISLPALRRRLRRRRRFRDGRRAAADSSRRVARTNRI